MLPGAVEEAAQGAPSQFMAGVWITAYQLLAWHRSSRSTIGTWCTWAWASRGVPRRGRTVWGRAILWDRSPPRASTFPVSRVMGRAY
jgi:hypothetical protein